MGRVRVLAVASVLAVVSSASAADARTRVHVKLTVPQASVGMPTQITYGAQHLPRQDALFLQRQEGTGKVWRTISRLPHAHHTATIPALPIGVYSVRLAAIARHHRAVAQQRRALDVFGQVPFTTLFPGGAGAGDDLGPGTAQTATTTFPYAFAYYNGEVNFTALTIGSRNPCRSVTMQFLPFDPNSTDAEISQGTATLVQQSADPVSTTVQANNIGTITASLIPGQSWGLNVAQGGDGQYLFTWDINGSANCDKTRMR